MCKVMHRVRAYAENIKGFIHIERRGHDDRGAVGNEGWGTGGAGPFPQFIRGSK